MNTCKNCGLELPRKHVVVMKQGTHMNGKYCSPECVGQFANDAIKPVSDYPLGMTAAEMRSLLDYYADCEELLIAVSPEQSARIARCTRTAHGLSLFPQKYI